MRPISERRERTLETGHAGETGHAAPLFLLAVDHRRSFERLLAVERPLDDATHRQLAAAKVLVIDAVSAVAADHPEWRRLGVLLDDQYGGDALVAARRAGITVAVAFERSAQAVLEFQHTDWRDRLDALGASAERSPDGDTTDAAPMYAKVLVRHRTDGDADGNALQLERLVEISDACAGTSVGFLLEVLTPFTAAERAAHDPAELEASWRAQLVVDAIAEIQAAGVAADVWKVEGVNDASQCAAIAGQARSGRRDVGVVVLGAGADDDTVADWLRAAASAGYSGFAVGRSIWADSLRERHRGEIDDATAVEHMAAKYADLVALFTGLAEAH